MGELLKQTPELNLDVVPRHLHALALSGQELIDRSFNDPESLHTPPAHTEESNGMHRAYWEYELESGQYERFAVHLAGNALLIVHEHRHNNSELPYVGMQPPKEFVRTTLVTEKLKATLFHHDPIGRSPSEEITDAPEKGILFGRRVDHVLGILGIELSSEELQKVG